MQVLQRLLKLPMSLSLLIRVDGLILAWIGKVEKVEKIVANGFQVLMVLFQNELHCN